MSDFAASGREMTGVAETTLAGQGGAEVMVPVMSGDAEVLCAGAEVMVPAMWVELRDPADPV